MVVLNLLRLLCLAVAVNAKWVTPPKKEGHVCNTVRGELWKCTKASECSVYSKLKRSKYLSICSMEGSEQIICCPKSARVAKRASISEQKCQEYQSNICSNNEPSIVHSSHNEPMEDFMEERPEEGWVIPDVGIFGGTRVQPGEFPHSALIGYGDEKNILWSCGGTLISKNYVLGAAHCVNSTNGLARWVLLGDVDYTTTFEEEGAQKFQIVHRVQHEQYREQAFYHDVGLFRLDRDVVFTQNVAPACLYSGRSNPSGQGIALGWGVTGPNKGPSEVLMKVFLDFVAADQCGKVMIPMTRNKLPNGVVDSNMICAYKKSKAMCSGDSGSGIVLADKSDSCLHRLAGVMSFSGGCFEHNVPSAFMRVSPYIEWIEKIVWPQGGIN